MVPAPPRGGVTRWLPAVWAVVLSVLLLGPSLLPGYVLIRDMVWVPDLSFRADILGFGPGVPRAVPSDALVAVLDELVPGMLLQKLALLGSLVSAGVGFASLVPARLDARLAATTVAIWNPYVVERLAIGHWPMIVCVGVLPWLVAAGSKFAVNSRLGPGLPILVVLGSLNSNAGVVSSVVLLAFGWSRSRHWWKLAACCAMAQAPWILAGVAHLSQAKAAEGFDFFGANSDGLPLPLSTLTLGGIWNLEVVPHSRSTLLVVVGLVWTLAMVAVGSARLLRFRGRRWVATAGLLWTAGWTIAVVGWASPGSLATIGDLIPGGAMLRDSARMLPLCMPLLISLIGVAVTVLVDAAATTLVRVVVAGSTILLPIMVLPDAAMGIAGQLQAVAYPGSWLSVRDVVDPRHGDALYLPLANYRSLEFNGMRPVTDPLPRLLRPSAVIDDDLVLNIGTVAGEDPRLPLVRVALAEPDSASRAASLERLGIGWVIVQTAAGDSPSVAGNVIRSGDLVVTKLANPRPPERIHGWPAGLIWSGWILYLLLLGSSAARFAVMGLAKFRQKSEVSQTAVRMAADEREVTGPCVDF